MRLRKRQLQCSPTKQERKKCDCISHFFFFASAGFEGRRVRTVKNTISLLYHSSPRLHISFV